MISHRKRVDDGGLTLFLALITVALFMVISSFVSALLWSALGALLFQPFFQRLLTRWPERRNTAAAATMIIITIAIVIPALVIASLIVEQAAGVYEQMRTGQVDFARYFGQVHDALPYRVQHFLNAAGFESFERAQSRISLAISNSISVIARQAFSIGANAAAFMLVFAVGLYVTFFLLRDGEFLGPAVVTALPLEQSVATKLADKFVTVVRATIKGSGLVALVQGSLGAATFAIVGLPAALLWGMLMAIAALLPAIGPAIVWAPVAIYLLAIGDIWQAIIVLASGMIVIGLADNILRPILVGRDAGIPDWLVLVTTLGGIELLGLSGLVLGPLAGALFITGWQIFAERRSGGALPSLVSTPDPGASTPT